MASGRRYDVVFDMVPSTDYAAAIALLEDGGRYLCGNPRFSVLLRSALTTRFSDKTASCAFAAESREELDALTAMIEAGELRPIVDRVFAMEGAAEAHRRVETEERIGAVVLEIA